MSHACRLEVDLAALRHNTQLARDLAGGRGVIAAVKADAYGHGLVPVARAIADLVDGYGVARLEEAQALRRADILAPILKFTHTFTDEFSAAIEAGVTIAVESDAEVEALAQAARALGRSAEVQLKIDTGMRRYGVSPDEAPTVAAAIDDCHQLRLTGVFTHLALSDSPAGDEFTRAQLDAFHRAARRVAQQHGKPLDIHAANSGALLRHELGGSTMVRPGIMLYGGAPDASFPDHRLQPVQRWTARVASVRDVSKGESVGYGRTWVAPRDTCVATVAVGYADGYSRLLSNRGRMLIGGRSYPIAGRVCMDQTMVDLGPGGHGVNEGDEAVLLGASGAHRITVDELADLMGTINYEVTCLITDRVKRIYC